MKYTTLGASGAVVSALSLGTMTFGVESAPEVAHLQLDTFVEAGGTLIETADVYGDGEAERIVGAWLATRSARERADLFLAGKGRFPVGVSARDAGLSRRHLSRALDDSLRRLGCDHIDLYQLHAWDPLTPLEESLGFLEDAVRVGKISYGGLSNFTGWQIALAVGTAKGHLPLISMQPQYNLLAREVEWEIVPACLATGLGILPWSPLGGGWLTGKYRRDTPPTGATRLGENPQRGVEAYGLRSSRERTWRTLDAVAAIAAEHGLSMAQVSLAWLHAQPGVSSIVLGARTVDQLADNLGALDVALTEEELKALTQASDPEPADYPYGDAGVEQRSRPIN